MFFEIDSTRIILSCCFCYQLETKPLDSAFQLAMTVRVYKILLSVSKWKNFSVDLCLNFDRRCCNWLVNRYSHINNVENKLLARSSHILRGAVSFATGLFLKYRFKNLN